MAAPRRRAPLVSPAAVRAWATSSGVELPDGDELPQAVVDAYLRRKERATTSAAEERLKAETADAWKAVRQQASAPKPPATNAKPPATKKKPAKATATKPAATKPDATKAKASRDAEAKKAAQARAAAEKAAACDKAAADKAERERVAAEARAAKAAEQERVAAEKEAARQTAAADKAERERLARAAAAEADRLAAEAGDGGAVATRATVPSAPRILVVDDEESMRSWLRVQLERSGWEVGEAEDGATALTQFDAERAGVVVLDEYMPGMRGLEVARELRARDSEVTLLLFSASVDRAVIDEAERLAVHFVSKINLDLLLNHLELLHGTLARAG